MTTVSALLSAILFLSICASLAGVAPSVHAQAQPQTAAPTSSNCPPFWSRGNWIDPASWGTSYDLYYFNDGVSVYWGIDLCSNLLLTIPPTANNSNPASGFVVSLPFNAGGSFPEMAFDVLYETRVEEYSYHRLFSSSTTNGSFVEVNVRCNASATLLAPNSVYPRVESRPIGTVYIFSLGISQLCDSVTTTATSQPASTTAMPVPSIACRNVSFDGSNIDPNKWGYFGGHLAIPAYPDSGTDVFGDICHMFPSYTPGPGYAPNPGYIVVSPTGSVFAPVSFDMRQREEVNELGQFVKWKFNSSTNPDSILFVYVACDPAAESLTFTKKQLNYYYNVEGGIDFEIYLGHRSLCPASTTPVPAVTCRPFVNVAGQTKNPGAFPPGQGLLKNVMSGASVTAFVDLCNAHHYTPIPGHAFHFGFVVFAYSSSAEPFPQISFDVIETMFYLAEFNQLRITYRSTMANYTQDDAVVQVSCGGGAGLTFSNRYVFPRRNNRGGNSYVLEVVTQHMCLGTTTRAPLPPPPLTTAAMSTLAPTPAPLPPQTTVTPSTAPETTSNALLK